MFSDDNIKASTSIKLDTINWLINEDTTDPVKSFLSSNDSLDFYRGKSKYKWGNILFVLADTAGFMKAYGVLDFPE